jgi:hypothetical protein
MSRKPDRVKSARQGSEGGIIPLKARSRGTFGVRLSLEGMIDRFASRLHARQEELKRLTDQGPVIGSIWSTHPETQEDVFGPLVLILENQGSGLDTLLVAEITQNYRRGTEGNIVLPRQASGLHFSCMVVVSVVFLLKPQKLRACAGKLSEHQTRQIRELVSCPT